MIPPASHCAKSIPPGARKNLRPDHPRLLALKERYSKFDSPVVDHSWWTSALTDSQIEWPYVRGDNAYVWQARDNNRLENYRITAEYIKAHDHLGLLNSLNEDGEFGVFHYDLGSDLTVSRDLLDSVNEIYFLENQLKLSSWHGVNFLDIGAGYGRLAHRMIEGMPTVGRYFCVDAVPESTFISEYYLSYRNVDNKAQAVALDEVEGLLDRQKIDIALNIHSFSECSLEAVEWWLNLLCEHRINYLMIVPNAYPDGGEKLVSAKVGRQYPAYDHLLERYGYGLICRQPKYLDPLVQKQGVSSTFYYLYEWQG